MEWPLPEAGHSPQADHSLSSTGQWLGGRIPQANEGGTQGEDGEWGLVWPPH